MGNQLPVSPLSHEQFNDSYRHADFRKSKDHKKPTTADDVYGQLAGDYPAHALKWVHDVTWSGPKQIPLSKIDWDTDQFAKAEKQQAHVGRFVKMIESGQDMKPVLAIKRPGVNLEMSPDGHHRFLAYKQSGKKSAYGYVGVTKSVEGPWDYLHNSQFSDTKKNSLYR